MKTKQSQGNVVIRKDAKVLTPDIASRIFFGMPLNELVKDIQKNPDGKYNDLFVKDVHKKGR